MRQCRRCSKMLGIDAYYKRASGTFFNCCKKCESEKTMLRRKPKQHAATNKIWSSKHPDKIRNANLKAAYGITLEDYKSMLAKQNGTCAICLAVDSGPSRKDPKKTEPLFVDHNHKTGKIRGLLCRTHNTALGLFADNIELLNKAKAYLCANN